MGRGPHGDFRITAEDTGQTRARRAKAALSLRYPQSRATEICQWLECLSISRLVPQTPPSPRVPAHSHARPRLQKFIVVGEAIFDGIRRLLHHATRSIWLACRV